MRQRSNGPPLRSSTFSGFDDHGDANITAFPLVSSPLAERPPTTLFNSEIPLALRPGASTSSRPPTLYSLGSGTPPPRSNTMNSNFRATPLSLSLTDQEPAVATTLSQLQALMRQTLDPEEQRRSQVLNWRNSEYQTTILGGGSPKDFSPRSDIPVTLRPANSISGPRQQDLPSPQVKPIPLRRSSLSQSSYVVPRSLTPGQPTSDTMRRRANSQPQLPDFPTFVPPLPAVPPPVPPTRTPPLSRTLMQHANRSEPDISAMKRRTDREANRSIASSSTILSSNSGSSAASSAMAEKPNLSIRTWDLDSKKKGSFSSGGKLKKQPTAAALAQMKAASSKDSVSPTCRWPFCFF